MDSIILKLFDIPDWLKDSKLYENFDHDEEIITVSSDKYDYYINRLLFLNHQ